MRLRCSLAVLRGEMAAKTRQTSGQGKYWRTTCRPTARGRPIEFVRQMSLTLFSLWTHNFHLFAPFPRSEEKGNRRNFRETESSSFSLPRRVLCFLRLAATQVERDARPSVKFCSVALEFCIIRSLFFGVFLRPFSCQRRGWICLPPNFGRLRIF